ncbi:MAG: hypothetical protein H6555_08690 [Lewinellaceae bacterium]|nr:hypothetical protein [Lewinellaceae bacterium]
MSTRQNIWSRRPFFIKLGQWEYWPSWAFYWPMFLYGPWLALRARHICFFSAANPGIWAGGLGLESKFATLANIPVAFRPRSVLAPAGISPQALTDTLNAAGLTFPLIAKPDIGYRGLLVRKLNTLEELINYLQRIPVDFIVQEYLDYPEEIGVLYHRLPGQEQGQITSLTLKTFLHVVGDGQSTVAELIQRQPRAILQWDRLQETQWEILHTVPTQGQHIPLGIVGNHAKGTQFINGNEHIDAALVKTFDQLTQDIPGYFYGRFDLKCTSLSDLKAGRNFKVIELNGVCSEPTHIYDPTHMSYIGALRAILKHWAIIRRVAVANHRQGVSFLPLRDMLKGLRHLRAYHRQIEATGLR